MATKSICILSGIYPPDSGGPANFALTFSNFLLEKEFEVSVKTYTDGNTFHANQGDLDVKAISRKNSILIRYIQMVLEILREAKKGSYIIANGCFIEIALARLVYNFNYFTKVPGDIVWERAQTMGRTSKSIEEFQEEILSTKNQIFRKLFNRSLKKSRKVIVPSPQLATLCERWGVDKTKIAVIRNSVDTDKFKPENVVEHTYDFVTVCRLVPWKGVDQIIKCVKELEASLLIIGDGPERNHLELLAADSTNAIDFVGDISRERVLVELRKCKVFVLNSNYEATSYALLEAMACGLPGIANGNTGSVEIITHQIDGLLCGSKTSLNLLEAMQALFSNQELRVSMAESAQKKVKTDFAMHTNFGQILEVVTNAKK
jgi:glycosyltransferase involved in cell wall biosynthesis